MCISQDSSQILAECMKTFQAIHTISQQTVATHSAVENKKKVPAVVIEGELLEQTISEIRSALQDHRADQEDLPPLEAIGMDPHSSLFYSCTGDQDNLLLGEEVYAVKSEIRPLYFGLKNIILQEMESLDKEIDVHKFFIEEETAGFPASANPDLLSRSRSHYTGPSTQVPPQIDQSPFLDATSSDIASQQH